MTMLETFLLLTRLLLGAFFCISGYHKLTNASRHEMLVNTLKANNIPFVSFNQYWVPAVEFAAGLAVCFGMFWPLPLIGLLTICLVACTTDGIARIKAWKPIDFADVIDDVLYLPEVLYMLLIAMLLLFGYGAYALGLNIWELLT